jgi:neutral ceramidase
MMIMKQPLVCSLIFLLLGSTAQAQQSQNYLIGRGMSDITGPAFGIQMWGFGREDQITEGIHIRLRARAFVVSEMNTRKRFAFVSADIGSIEHHVTLEVVDRLKPRFGETYTLDNVILSATHTHAGPGGYWHSRTDLGLDGGFYPEHFEIIVGGIVEAIIKAHDDLQPGRIFIDKGRVEEAGTNRSLIAYEQNPEEERSKYADSIDKEMTLLKFIDESGEIGLINWYAVHPTSMTYYNRLISGDHKGYASLAVERLKGTTYRSAEDFVAAFAQANPGDVTANLNLDNSGPGKDDFDSTKIIGSRQLDVALDLFESADEPLVGPIDYRRMYVDLSDFTVEDRFTGAGVQTTCPSAYGYSFAGGSTEDGGGHFLFREGMTEQNFLLDYLIRFLTGAPEWTQAVKDCQSPKPILFETGSGNPPQQSQIRAISLVRLGQLVILAVPAEVTTMAGRRLRNTVMEQLGDWARHIVIAGYSNGYAGYVTTPEEYLLQQYEGGHTLHGRWTLPAYQQVAAQLATALENHTEVVESTAYDDWRGKSPKTALHDGKAPVLTSGVKFGDALPLERTIYSPGDVVTAQFWSDNPTANRKAGHNFLQIEQKQDRGWVSIASDGDWSTKIRWQRADESEALIAQLSWETGEAGTGTYRIRYLGRYASIGGTVHDFEGVSEPFKIE